MRYEFELDDLDDVVAMFHDYAFLVAPIVADRRSANVGFLHCGHCGERRRMLTSVEFVKSWPANMRIIPGAVPSGATQYAPCLMIHTCLQCQRQQTALVYHGPSGPALATFASSHSGVSTPNTPAAVAFYLDQAHRSHWVGANSASVAMYRAALDQLLENQGYTSGMLGQKVSTLISDLQAAKAPKWADELDTDFLGLMNKLGSGAIHPNGGDIGKQDALDAALVREVARLFSYLLFVIFEAPVKRQALKGGLQAKAAIVKK